MRCDIIKSVQNFNDKKIKIGSYLWFTSVFSVPSGSGPLRIYMTDSKVQFASKTQRFTVNTPNMSATVRDFRQPRLGGDRNTWRFDAPLAAKGNYFFNGVTYKTRSVIEKNAKDVTWSARIYANRDVKLSWQWGAAVYTQFGRNANSLHVKPLNDHNYRPYNRNPAGTPEAFKQWLIPGGTGMGDKEFTGELSPAVSVTPCR